MLAGRRAISIASHCCFATYHRSLNLKQVNRMKTIMQKLSFQSNKDISRRLIAEALQLVMNSFETRDWLLANHLAYQTRIEYFQPSDLDRLAKCISSALSLSTIYPQNVLNIVKSLDIYNYELDPKADAKFVEIVKEAVGQGPSFVSKLCEQLSLPTKEFKKVVDVALLEDDCKRLVQSKEAMESVEHAKQYYRIMKNGLIHDLWSNDFKGERFYDQAFAGTPYLSSLKNLVDFEFCRKLEDCEIEIKAASLPYASNSEAKIGRYLQETGYQFLAGPKIFGYEVDFIVGKHVIVEYNGFKHYYINAPTRLTRLYEWKYDRLRRMGFNVVLIAGREWEQLERKEKQIEELVCRIEEPLVARITKS